MEDLNEIFTPAELAERWGMAVGSLSNLRVKGGGCVFTRNGRKIIYLRADVVAYETAGRMLANSVKAPKAE